MRHNLKQWEQVATPGQAYQICVTLPRSDDSSSHTSPSWHTKAMLEWLDEPGASVSLKRVLLDGRDGYSWEGRHVAPANTKALRVALFHYNQLSPPPEWSANDAEFRCQETEPMAPRHARLAVAFQQAAIQATVEGNIQVLVDTVREAGKQKIDLLCMTETLPGRNVEASMEDRAVSLDDPRLQPLWTAIQESGLWTVFSLLEKRSDENHGTLLYNTALLISSDGAIVGTYSKRQLTVSELEHGVTPGQDYPVFTTPWGKLGILICWDGWFPESATALARKGAEIICMPLAGDGNPQHWEHGWRTRAIDNQVFWLTSVTADCASGAPSRIISPAGEVLAETREPDSLAIAEVDIAQREELFWLSFGPCMAEIRNVYAHARDELC